MLSRTVSNTDWTVLAPEVCVRLLGDPSSRSSREWRWGRHGSFRLKLETGTWNDFETGDGGGVIALVMREERCDRTGAAEWLRQQGFLPDRDRSQRSTRAIRSRNTKSAPPSNTRSAAAKKNTANSQRRQHVNDVIRQAREIPMDPEHPVRLWAEQRNLWRADVPFPRRMTQRGIRHTLLWLPESASLFKGQHMGAGSVVAPVAPIADWQRAYPDHPAPKGLQLIAIDSQGNASVDRPKEVGGLGKRSLAIPGGTMNDAVLMIGEARPELAMGIAICEGVADGLAIASRFPQTSVVLLGAGKAKRVAPALADYNVIDLFADNDEAGERLGKILLDTLTAMGLAGRVRSFNFVQSKDAAESAAGAPFVYPITEATEQHASDLVRDGYDEYEALRLALTLSMQESPDDT